jgi:hypothetical protein
MALRAMRPNHVSLDHLRLLQVFMEKLGTAFLPLCVPIRPRVDTFWGPRGNMPNTQSWEGTQIPNVHSTKPD